MIDNQRSIRMLAIRGVYWSVIQNWGGRLFTLCLFIVLARFLSPVDYGTASTAALVLMVTQMLAEFGFGDAIVQQSRLSPEDVNLPFYTSLFVSIIFALLIAAFSPRIEQYLSVQGLAHVLIALGAAMPLNTLSQFQEVHYRRDLDFRPLAMRTFVANIVGGLAAILAAVAGFGVWSIVIQSYLITLVSVLWLWHKPRWVPTLKFDLLSYIALIRFGSSTVGLRLVDFMSVRLVEIIIVGRYGLATYGLYTVGARLYQTLMQLFQSALYDVSLSVLSKIADDRERLAALYLRSVELFAHMSAPVFVLVAALAPEICGVLFGSKWAGVDVVARPLLLLGALQCVQFVNGPFLYARGRPHFVLVAGIAKATATAVGLAFVTTQSLSQFALVFVVGQLAATPITFGFLLRELDMRWSRVLRLLFAPYAVLFIAFTVVTRIRPGLVVLLPGQFSRGLTLGLVFSLIYLTYICIFRRAMLQRCTDLALQRIQRSGYAA